MGHLYSSAFPSIRRLAHCRAVLFYFIFNRLWFLYVIGGWEGFQSPFVTGLFLCWSWCFWKLPLCPTPPTSQRLCPPSGQTEKYCNIFYMSHRHEKNWEVCWICHYIGHGKTNTNLFALNFKFSPYTTGFSMRNYFIVGIQSSERNLSPLEEIAREIFLPELQ